MPLIAIGLYLLLRYIPRIDPARRNYASFADTYLLIRVAMMVYLAFIVRRDPARHRARGVRPGRRADHRRGRPAAHGARGGDAPAEAQLVRGHPDPVDAVQHALVGAHPPGGRLGVHRDRRADDGARAGRRRARDRRDDGRDARRESSGSSSTPTSSGATTPTRCRSQTSRTARTDRAGQSRPAPALSPRTSAARPGSVGARHGRARPADRRTRRPPPHARRPPPWRDPRRRRRHHQGRAAVMLVRLAGHQPVGLQGVHHLGGGPGRDVQTLRQLAEPHRPVAVQRAERSGLPRRDAQRREGDVGVAS